MDIVALLSRFFFIHLIQLPVNKPIKNLKLLIILTIKNTCTVFRMRCTNTAMAKHHFTCKLIGIKKMMLFAHNFATVDIQAIKSCIRMTVLM